MSAHENRCELPLAIRVDGERQASCTTFLRSCAYTALIETEAVTRGLRVQLSSDYLGFGDRTARSTHVADVHERRSRARAGWSGARHPPGEVDVRWLPSGCLYDHLFRLLDLLKRVGRSGSIDVSDEVLAPFDALARGASVATRSATPACPRSDFAAVRGVRALPGASGQGYPQT